MRNNQLLEKFFAAAFDRDALLFRQYWLDGTSLRRTERFTLSSLLPCILYDNGEPFRLCREAVERHCVPGGTFWKGILPSFNPVSRSQRSGMLWRGSCSWMNMNYMVFRLLMMHGYGREARLLYRRLDEYIAACGPREYFDAFEKRGGGATTFSWNGLLLAMGEALD